MTRTTEALIPKLQEYVAANSTPPDEVLLDLAAETEKLFPDDNYMQIGPEQGAFMTLLARIAGAGQVVEIGTFTGYSAICLARGLRPGGTLLACDISEEWTSVAQRYWKRAGLDDTITLRLGPALDTLRALPAEPQFDLAFVDAEKEDYVDYWEELVPRIRPGGLILGDNTLHHGQVVDPEENATNVQGIRAYNARVREDDRVEQVLIPIGDGLNLARKK
ncbi:O-methyltransferase [Streptomyces geranii]|uniref:O-methyltransferase n=1 Tax=Streptomyces geranii TaxID=2058923 RepID=UPI000D02CAC5|nr:O-methyltransferase [Streptomyces geranii]